ncbi:glutathione S-transferase N-terminal domain-containing protein [Parapedomonas caeni]
MLTFHHLRVSQSDRTVWPCEALELPCELVLHQRNPITPTAAEAYRQLHPSGTAPVITDGALVLTEIGAIVEYLLAREGVMAGWW